MTNTPDSSFFVELFGIGLAGIFFSGVVGLIAVAFWFFFCWPQSNTPQLIPFIMPIRITIVTSIAFLVYNRLSRPRKPGRGFEREWELIAVLLILTLMGFSSYFLGVSDGATNISEEVLKYVQMRRALTIVLPTVTFAIIGYCKAKASPRMIAPVEMAESTQP